MVELIAPRARAYVLRGDWVADCTRPSCANAEYLCDRTNPRDPRSPRSRPKPGFHCSNCQQIAPIEWPQQMDEIMAVLQLRPVPQTRNWFPAGHESTRNYPQGQSIDELRAENREHDVPAVLGEAIH